MRGELSLATALLLTNGPYKFTFQLSYLHLRTVLSERRLMVSYQPGYSRCQWLIWIGMPARRRSRGTTTRELSGLLARREPRGVRV